MNKGETLKIRKASGALEPFDRSKLEASLQRAGANPALINEIANHIELELEDGMSTSHIYKHAFFLLDKNQKGAAAKYSLRRAVMELGPSGFPFEDFIASMFRAKGFEAKTGEAMLGSCVEHEVDVVAYNENKMIICEAKFHNKLGIKSDLKVVLYIKARTDDLKDVVFMYGKERKIDESWVITNTKFTSTAIHYGECQNLKIIGWNYPKVGNLQDMIEDSGLHPITCLSSLSQSQKNLLLSQGTVLCKDLKNNEDALHSLGLSKNQIKETIQEASVFV